MAFLRRLYRLPLLLLLLVLGLLCLILIQPWLPLQGRRSMVRAWSWAFLRVCGVRVNETWAGEGPARTLAELAPGRMIISNHVSWLDVFAINAQAASAFVAKAEIQRWPVVGWLVSLAGTVFIKRGDTQAIPDVIRQMRERLSQGYPVALFPEATTHVGPTLRKFHGKLLQAAIDEQAELVPLGIQFLYADGSPAEAAWYVGDTTFAQSFWSVLGASGIGVRMVVLSPVGTVGAEKGALAGEVRGRICVGLGVAVDVMAS